MAAPLESMQMALPIRTPAADELITNKLEAIAERKDPNRQRAKDPKYVAYGVRGFGTFIPAIGIGGIWTGSSKSYQARRK